MKRTNRRRWGKWAAVVLVLGALLAGRFIRWPSDALQYDGRQVTVAHVLGPDRIDVHAPDQKNQLVSVRLIGVAAGDASSDPASDWLRNACDGQTLTLTMDRRRAGRDDEGALCAFVYREDGSLLNEQIIEQGLAASRPDASHRLSIWFDRLEGWARDRGSGQWADAGQ